MYVDLLVYISTFVPIHDDIKMNNAQNNKLITNREVRELSPLLALAVSVIKTHKEI